MAGVERFELPTRGFGILQNQYKNHSLNKGFK
ncbi:hypothetical protein EDB58_1061, partial [Vibrio crassostreae]